MKDNEQAAINEEEDDDAVYESDAMKTFDAQRNLSAKVRAWLEAQAENPEWKFGKYRKEEYEAMIKEKFPECFWAWEIVEDNYARLAKRNREVRMANKGEQK